MHNLDEVGHVLGEGGQGLLFTLPRRRNQALAAGRRRPDVGYGGASPIDQPQGFGSAPMVDLASRHAQEASETLKVLQDGDEENDG